MRFFVRLISILVLSFILQFVIPFWSVAVVAFFVCLFLSKRPKRWGFGKTKKHYSLSFLAGFLAISMLWGGMAWWLDSRNASLLSTLMADLLLESTSLTLDNSQKPILLIGITAFLGGILGGMSAFTGNILGIIIKR